MSTSDRAKAEMQSDPDDPRHGTGYGYSGLGCRCDFCREANSARPGEGGPDRWNGRLNTTGNGNTQGRRWSCAADGHLPDAASCDYCSEVGR